jgi:hypothetical protein
MFFGETEIKKIVTDTAKSEMEYNILYSVQQWETYQADTDISGFLWC